VLVLTSRALLIVMLDTLVVAMASKMIRVDLGTSIETLQ
jgi:hypothetical protein